MKTFVVGVAICAMSALAQNGSQPKFEVAVIKPVDTIQIDQPGAAFGATVTAQQITIRLPMKQLLEIAYEVRPGGVEGPDSFMRPKTSADAGIFDISARLPEGATAAQIPGMLRALLEERFKLSTHRSSKQQNIYALVIGKNGVKFPLKAAGAESMDCSPLTWSAAQGSPTLQAGGAKMTRGAEGVATIEACHPVGLAYMLTMNSGLRLPVIDKTELKGAFDIKVEMSRGELPAAPITQAGIDQMQVDRVVIAVEKIGLKLEERKDQVETIVVDHIERMPTEN